MGKKGKRSSKSKKTSIKSKKSKKGEKEKPVQKSIQLDPDLLKELTKDLDEIFRFPNGDAYIGHFTITKDGDLHRHGRGKYLTADGCSFSGLWVDDRLVEAERISYPDGSWYRGPLDVECGRYSGQGAYNVPQIGVMDCVFVQGRPLGKVTVNDEGKIWQGQAGEGTLTLVPRNHLFDSEEVWCQAAKTAAKTAESAIPPKRSSESKNEAAKTAKRDSIPPKRSSELKNEAAKKAESNSIPPKRSSESKNEAAKKAE